MNGTKNKSVLLFLLISIITLSLIASTYAFVRLSTTNQNNFRTSLKAGTMSLVFSDGNPGFNTQISLGGSVEKIFTIENTGQAETYATMSWKELQNTYTPGSLVYTLEESSDGGLNYTSRVNTTPVPTSNTGLTVAENLTIPVGTTMYYKLTISYIFLEDVNQTQDLHAYLNTLFTLEEGSFIDKAILITKETNNYWSSTDYKDKIKTASFVQGINVPDEAIVSWDMSTAGDGRIMAYLVNNEDSTDDTPLYDLYVATDRMQIYAYNTKNLFFGLNNVENFYNLELLNTSYTTYMTHMFANCMSLENLDLSSFDTSNVTDMKNMFFYDTNLVNLTINNFNTSKVIDMHSMFQNCTSLPNLDLSSFDTSQVKSMSQMFEHCSSLTEIDLINFNTLNVTDMSHMFGYCENLISFDFNSFNTSNVTDMSDMFIGCSSLASLDISNLNTSNAINMSGIFYDCSGLTEMDLSNFDTSNVRDISGIFYGCSGLTEIDLSNFDTSNVTNMSYLFHGCSGLTKIDLSNFNTSNVTNMSWVFYNCTNLKTIYISNLWNTSSVTSSTNMFAGCTKLIGGTGTTFNSSYKDASYAHIDEGPSNPGYLTLKTV